MCDRQQDGFHWSHWHCWPRSVSCWLQLISLVWHLKPTWNRGVCDITRSMDSVGRSYHSMSTQVLSLGYSTGQGFILVYSVTSRVSFERLQMWLQAMLHVNQSPLFILVGNKLDIPPEEREVLKEEGAALARLFCCLFMETSAKEGHNVELPFTNMVRLLRGTQPTDTTHSPRTALDGQNPWKSKYCLIMWWTSCCNLTHSPLVSPPIHLNLHHFTCCTITC